MALGPRNGAALPHYVAPYAAYVLVLAAPATLVSRPVAYALYFFTYSSFLARPTLYLEDLFVLPEARRHGMGGAMLRALAERALAADCGRMEWAALTWNRLAIDFYERLGAKALEEWRTFRLDGPGIARMAGRP